jgi:hypothetical protein
LIVPFYFLNAFWTLIVQRCLQILFCMEPCVFVSQMPFHHTTISHIPFLLVTVPFNTLVHVCFRLWNSCFYPSELFVYYYYYSLSASQSTQRFIYSSARYSSYYTFIPGLKSKEKKLPVGPLTVSAH